jgi:hypothetical protein
VPHLDGRCAEIRALSGGTSLATWDREDGMREDIFPTKRDAASQDPVRKAARHLHETASERTERERRAIEEEEGAYNLPFTD